MLAAGQAAPQPPRVAGPQQITPCSRRQTSGSGANVAMERNSVMRFSVLVRSHSSHRETSLAPTTDPGAGRRSPAIASITSHKRSVAGGQPGRK